MKPGADPSAQDPSAKGGFHALRGEWAKAEPHLRLAAALKPGDPARRHALALALMAQGKLREGLPLYAHRWSVPGLGISRPRFDCPEWRGEDPAGRHIVIFPEQGLGDQIMFARYAPALAARGAEVTLICLPPLARLFEALGVRVVAAQGRMEFPDPDCWVLLGDLPLRLGAFEIPGAPYLRGKAQGAARAAGGVGLVRRGNPAHPNDANRSLPDGLTVPFPTVSLDPAHTGARDMQDTANIVAGLDAVVTVDTSVAHLAGAMGKPVHILLPAAGVDWRWGEAARTPWYPTARLHRQTQPGDWGPVLAGVARALEAGGA